MSGCVTFNSCSFIRLGISLPFGDNTTDNSSILILSYVLASKFKQLDLQILDIKIIHINKRIKIPCRFYQQSTISRTLTSKIRVALGGILGGLPADPYAYSGLQMSWHNSPTFIVATPISHAFIT